MSIHSIRFRIASALTVPLDDVEVVLPGTGYRGDELPGGVRVGNRRWDVSESMLDQDEELINRVVLACRHTPELVG